MELIGGRAAGAWFSRQAVRRGLLGSSRLWLAAFVARGVLKLARRAVGSRRPATVLEERLEPGARIEVRHFGASENRRDPSASRRSRSPAVRAQADRATASYVRAAPLRLFARSAGKGRA